MICSSCVPDAVAASATLAVMKLVLSQHCIKVPGSCNKGDCQPIITQLLRDWPALPAEHQHDDAAEGGENLRGDNEFTVLD